MNKEEVFHWYALKTNVNNEDDVAKSISESVDYYNLWNKIKQVCVLKRYEIKHSKEFYPNSEELPQKGVFRNTQKSQWIRLKNLNYQKIRLVEDKPFKNLVFLRMVDDKLLRQEVRKWHSGVNFLEPMISDDAFDLMAKPFLNKTQPDLQAYLVENNLIDLTVSNSISNVASGKKAHKQVAKNVQAKDEWNNFDVISHETVERIFTNTTFLSHKSDEDNLGMGALNIVGGNNLEHEQTKTQSIPNFQPSVSETVVVTKPTLPSRSSVHLDESLLQTEIVEENLTPINFKVGDEVFISKMGVNGNVKEINHKKREVVVEFELFGRAQNVHVAPEELQNDK